MIASRRMPNPTSSDQKNPSPSGPRWRSPSFMRCSVARSVRNEPSMPEMPHIGFGHNITGNCTDVIRIGGACGAYYLVNMVGIRRMALRAGVVCAAVALMGLTTGLANAADDDWPTYHHSADRAGNAANG